MVNESKSATVRLQTDTIERLRALKAVIHQKVNRASNAMADIPIIIGEPSYDQVVNTLLTFWEVSQREGKAK